MEPTPSRRNFLLGQLGTASDRAASGEARGAEESFLVHVSRRAMACEFEICLNAGQYASGTEAALEALDLLEPLEGQMSVFRPGSEVSRINLLAAEQPVEVEPRLFELLQLAMALHRETGGAYDITAGPLWEVWGFARRAGAIPSERELAEARDRVGAHLVELDEQRRTVRFLRPGVKLNLGSIGKGFAADRCAETLLAAGVNDFLLHGGNSSVLARGARGHVGHVSDLPSRGEAGPVPDTPSSASLKLAPRSGWAIGVRDPLHPDRRLAEVRLRDQALGTSGSQFQSFRHRGRRYGHILDPRTGWPAEGVLSATVLAPTAALADALSTAFYVMGAQAAVDCCRDRPEIAAVLICPGPGGAGREIVQVGMEGAGFRILAPGEGV